MNRRIAKALFKARTITFLFLFSVSHLAQAQQSQLLKDLDESIQEMESFIKLSQTRIELSTAKQQAFDPKDKSNFQQISLAENIDRNSLQRHFDSLSVKTSLVYPYNYVSINTENEHLLKLLGKDNFYFMENPDKKAIFQPIQATYLDGTEEALQGKYMSLPLIAQKYKKTIEENGESYEIVEIDSNDKLANEMWEERSSFYESLIIKNARPLKMLKANIQLPVQSKNIAYLNKPGDSIATEYGPIRLLGLSGSEAVLQMPSLIDDNVALYGLYKDGQMLSNKASSSFTVIADDKIAAYEAYLATLKETRTLVEKRKIKTEDELEQHLKEHTPKALLHNAADPDDTFLPSYTQSKITFAGPAAKIAVIRTLPETDTLTFQVTYHFNYKEDEKEYAVASDFETSKNGILNKSGKWLIEPLYDEYFRMINRYYFTDQIDDRENIYHYNPQTNKLTKVAYQLDDWEIYLSKYIKIEPRTNGLNGVANALTGEVVVPMQYEFIHLREDKVWVAQKDDMEGALDLDFKQLLPFSFSSIEFKEGFFYAKYDEGSKEDVYNVQGKNITNGKYTSIDGWYSSDRLLVQSAREEKPGYLTDVRYYFLDKEGKVAVDLNAKGLEDAEMFRNGLAAVKSTKTGLYGFIDPSGRLALPCAYSDITFGFFEASGYAPVKLSNGDYCLIDKKGNVQKKFNASFKAVNYRGDNRDLYLLVDNVWYNAFGEVVNE